MSSTDLQLFDAPQLGTGPSEARRPGELTSALRALGRELCSDRVSLIGFLILLALVLTAIFAPVLAPFDPTAQSLRARLLPPFWLARGTFAHVLGTDYLGRDVLSRLIYGSRASLGIGVSVVALAGSFGVVMGLIAGYLGGRTDNIIMRAIDTQVAFPGLLLALIILATIGPTPATVIVVLALNGWMVYARMTRGIVLSLRQMPFVEAAEMIGCRPRRVIFRHLLPNLISPLVTLMMLEFARVVLAEASLSFLGLGVQPPASSWGLDVATGKAYIFNAWWLATFPGFAIALTVLAINLVASWARVTSDPQEREKRFARQLTARIRTRPAGTLAPSGCAGGEQNLLAVRDLVVHFHTRGGTLQAVRGLSFDVRPGEVLGIVGETGSGKSVTAQAIMGLINMPGEICGGDILWKGRSLLQSQGQSYARRIRGKEVAIVFQDPMTSLNPLLTVGTQIGEVLRHHLNISAAAARERSIELLSLVGITAPKRRMAQYPYELSGGMCQRVMIAMALACEPELLIADEPTTALDVTIQSQILDLLASLQASLGLACMLITHDLGVIARMCDRVAVMYGGRIVEEGRAAVLFERPLHPYTGGLLRSTPRLAGQKQRLESIEGTPPNLLRPPAGCCFAARCASVKEQCKASDPPRILRADGRSAACWLLREIAADCASSQFGPQPHA
ncbi:MAG TPA: dipeptide/oligopeptide/nickel ABC transporter permease/ATP-binding protein [Xanthobacteraceae bacterium]|jgi:peptide/nickel transport system permease protein